MVLAAGSLADDPGVSPVEASEMIGERDAGKSGGGGRTATFSDGDIVPDLQGEGRDFARVAVEDFAVGVEDEMVFDCTADGFVAALGGDGEIGGGTRVNCDAEIHGESSGVEGGSQVGGRGGEREMERLRYFPSWHFDLTTTSSHVSQRQRDMGHPTWISTVSIYLLSVLMQKSPHLAPTPRELWGTRLMLLRLV